MKNIEYLKLFSQENDESIVFPNNFFMFFVKLFLGIKKKH